MRVPHVQPPVLLTAASVSKVLRAGAATQTERVLHLGLGAVRFLHVISEAVSELLKGLARPLRHVRRCLGGLLAGCAVDSAQVARHVDVVLLQVSSLLAFFVVLGAEVLDDFADARSGEAPGALLAAEEDVAVSALVLTDVIGRRFSDLKDVIKRLARNFVLNGCLPEGSRCISRNSFYAVSEAATAISF